MGYKCPNDKCSFYFQLDKWAITSGIITEDEFIINQDLIRKELAISESEKEESNLFNTTYIHEEYVLCGICSKELLLHNVVELKCGHVICKQCFKHFIIEMDNKNINKYICPKCNEEFELLFSFCKGDKQLEIIYEKNEKKINLDPLLECGSLVYCPKCKLLCNVFVIYILIKIG